MAISTGTIPTGSTRVGRANVARTAGLRADEFAGTGMPGYAMRERLSLLLVGVQAVLLVACLAPVGPVVTALQVRGLGWALLLLAALIGGLAVLALGRDTRVSPIPAGGARLHRNGIYAFIRHPMYLAVILGASGVTLLTGRLLALLATLALVATLTVKARVEDMLLQRKFGWEFAVYASRVPAILPAPWRSHRR